VVEINVPPWPSLAAAKLDAMYVPSSAIRALWMPSPTFSVPPAPFPE